MFGPVRTLIISLLLVASTLGLLPPAWSQGPPRREPKPAILEFGRETCPICRRMEQVLSRIKEAYGSQVEVRVLFVEREEHLFQVYRIVIIPTQVFLDASGREVYRHEGEISREGLVQKLKELKFIN